MSQQRHVIKKIKFDVGLPYAWEEGRHAQTKIMEELRDEVLPALSWELDQLVSKDEVFRIPFLEINLGDIDLENWKKEFIELFTQQLGTALDEKRVKADKNPSRGNGHIDFDEGNRVYLSKQHETWDLLSFFIENGHFPWWAKGKPWEELENEMIRELGRQDAFESIQALRRKILIKASYILRFFDQFSSSFFNQWFHLLLKKAVIELKKSLEPVRKGSTKEKFRKIGLGKTAQGLELYVNDLVKRGISGEQSRDFIYEVLVKWDLSHTQAVFYEKLIDQSIVRGFLTVSQDIFEKNNGVGLNGRVENHHSQNENKHPTQPNFKNGKSAEKAFLESEKENLGVEEFEERGVHAKLDEVSLKGKKEPDTRKENLAHSQNANQTGQREESTKPYSREKISKPEQEGQEELPLDLDKIAAGKNQDRENTNRSDQLSLNQTNLRKSPVSEEVIKINSESKTPRNEEALPQPPPALNTLEESHSRDNLTPSQKKTQAGKEQFEGIDIDPFMGKENSAKRDLVERRNSIGDEKPPSEQEDILLPKSSYEFVARKPWDAEEYFIDDAGLSLVLSTIAPLFKELNYLGKDGKFASPEKRSRAVHLLAYMGRGITHPTENLLVLSKLICGMPSEAVVPKNILLTQEEKEEVDTFLKALINAWGRLKNTSPEGLRNNFFLRDGILTFKEHQNAWVLKVEKKVYDALLMDTLPWTYSMIKFRWMPHLLRVEWL
ncbi:MAG: contractile injection system tape measure protein [Bacteroidia bacterium]|nr:contractile injection system tape measure protein [Bacteroidia bacterium]